MQVSKVSLSRVGTSNTSLHRVDIGPITLYFSYSTCVAFHVDHRSLVVCENIWSNTTGKHLNELDGGGDNKKERLSREEFVAQLQQVMDGISVEGEDA